MGRIEEGKIHPQCNHKEVNCASMEKQAGRGYGKCLKRNPFNCSFEPKPNEETREELIKLNRGKAGLQPDEGRLLTDKEFTEAIKGTRTSEEIENAIIAARDAKTASIKDAEYNKLLEAFKEVKLHRASLMDEVKENKAECQARIEALIEALKSCRNALAIIVDTDKPVDTRNIIEIADKAIATHTSKGGE